MRSSLFTTALILILAASGCSEPDTISVPEVDNGFVLAELSSNSINMLVEATSLQSMAGDYFYADVAHEERTFKLETAWVEGTGDYYYLIADGQFDDGDDRKMAVELSQLEHEGHTFLVLPFSG